MQRFGTTGCLSVLAAIYVVIIVLAPLPSIGSNEGWLENIVLPLLFPFMMFMPFAPPIVFAFLFDRIGPHGARLRRIARMISGALLALAMEYYSFAVAMAGRFFLPTNEDAWIFGVMLALSTGLAIFGFRSNKVMIKADGT